MTSQQRVVRPAASGGGCVSLPTAGAMAGLRGLPPEAWRALAAAASPARPVEANTDLVREGGRADTLYLILSGWAFRYATTRDGGRLLPALLLPGSVANLDTLHFDRLDYGVRTATRAEVAALPRDRALALAAEHPALAQAFTGLALTENAVLTRWALSLGRRSAKERLAHLICELNVRLGAETGNRSSFAFPLTQEQVADVLGLTPVHVNRILQRLRHDGLAQVANRTLTVPDVAALRRSCGFDPRYLHGEAAGHSVAA